MIVDYYLNSMTSPRTNYHNGDNQNEKGLALEARLVVVKVCFYIFNQIAGRGISHLAVFGHHLF